jgi:uncharacterized DUF497 family protein
MHKGPFTLIPWNSSVEVLTRGYARLRSKKCYHIFATLPDGTTRPGYGHSYWRRDFYLGRPKKCSNLRKHGIEFREAATVFYDPLSTTFPDDSHSVEEQRFVTVGSSARRRILVIAHTEEGDTIRIISARRATPGERRFYEEI